jgi:hypothetical protein
MRILWGGRTCMFALLLILIGCATEDHLKPPKPEESYLSPPHETRYDEFEYPKKYLMQDANKDFDLTQQDATKKGGGKGGGMGAGGGMGGLGY